MRSRLEVGRFLAICAALLAPACGDDGESMVVPDGGPPMTCEAPTPFATGSPDGHADPLGASAGQARAGRIAADQLPESRTGLAVWAGGDFVLANDRIAVIVEDVGPSDLYDPYGGRIVGVAVREGGTLVPADFNEILYGIGGFLVATESVTVLSDGSDGGDAVIRTTGPLAAIDFAGNLISGLVPGDYTGWPAAIDYRLAPDSDRVEISIQAISTEPTPTRVPMLLQGFFQTSRMPVWTATTGFAGLTGAQPWVVFDDPTGGASYGWLAPEGKAVQPVLEESGVLVTQGGPLLVPGCGSIEVPIGSVVVGRTFDSTQASLRASAGEASRTITGTVLDADGSPASDVRIHVTNGDAHLTRAMPNAAGEASIQTPDTDLQVWGYRRGTPIVGPIAVPRGTDTFTLEMPAIGTIAVSARDADTGTSVPARVQAFAVGSTVMRPPASWGEKGVVDERADVQFAGADGQATLRLAPGQWRIVVSRGFEYELVETTVTVTAGATEELVADLVHSVDTTGVQCADYHIHTTRSPDADDDADVKMASLVADGVEIAVKSDHEFISDFAPVVARLGLSDFVLGISGEELTTFEWGHFGVFPVLPDTSRPNGGAPRWPGRLPPAVFADARALPGDPTFIVNHPRSGGSVMGYFNAVGYDPATGMVNRPDHWDEQFSIVEVFNDSSFDQNRDGTVRDWFSFIRHGRRMFAVGSSDSHHIHSAPVGYPRTCLELPSDDPRDITPQQVRDATNAGHSTISGGIYMTVEAAGGAGPGDEVSGAGERAPVHVRLQAASWIGVDRLEVIVDGETVETIDLDSTVPSADVVRFDETIEVPVAATGSFVVFVASGDEPLEPLHRGRTPFAVSNPIFFRR